MEYTAVMQRADGWWIGWIDELPGINCQEESLEMLRSSLTEALREALEFNLIQPLT